MVKKKMGGEKKTCGLGWETLSTNAICAPDVYCLKLNRIFSQISIPATNKAQFVCVRARVREMIAHLNDNFIYDNYSH